MLRVDLNKIKKRIQDLSETANEIEFSLKMVPPGASSVTSIINEIECLEKLLQSEYKITRQKEFSILITPTSHA